MAARNFDELFGRLEAAEQAFLASEFLAPVIAGGDVRVRMAGVVCRLRVTPADFEGWGVFRPKSHAEAELVRAASLAERQRYLALFPLVRLIVCRRAALPSKSGGKRSSSELVWMGLPAHRGDERFRIDGLVPVRLAENVQTFDVVRARFDGGNFWFEDVDSARDPAMAAWLRRQLRQSVDPAQLERAGLTPEERTAYTLNALESAEIQRRREVVHGEQRLREALGHAGAELVDYVERGDGYRVTYSVAGREHVSSVRKDDLTVQVAGICLSGGDRAFDLASLVGVIREAEESGAIVPVGREDEGIAERDYWRVHPPNRD